MTKPIKSIVVEYIGPQNAPDDHAYRVVKANNTVEPRVGTKLREDALHELGRDGIAYTIVQHK